MTHLAEIRIPEPQNNSKNNGIRGRMGPIQWESVDQFMDIHMDMYLFYG